MKQPDFDTILVLLAITTIFAVTFITEGYTAFLRSLANISSGVLAVLIAGFYTQKHNLGWTTEGLLIGVLLSIVGIPIYAPTLNANISIIILVQTCIITGLLISYISTQLDTNKNRQPTTTND